jgi:hypothetical protein
MSQRTKVVTFLFEILNFQSLDFLKKQETSSKNWNSLSNKVPQ